MERKPSLPLLTTIAVLSLQELDVDIALQLALPLLIPAQVAGSYKLGTYFNKITLDDIVSSL